MTDVQLVPRPEKQPEKHLNILQGETCVDNDPGTVLTTVLGSCIAACIWDGSAKIGGMNHFLLPGGAAELKNLPLPGTAMRFGAHAMPALVEALLRRGARRPCLQAKLFGGARMIKGLSDIGELNARFAERFLQAEGIALVGGSLRGEQGRRIQFWPLSGRARQVFLPKETASILQAECSDLPPEWRSGWWQGGG